MLRQVILLSHCCMNVMPMSFGHFDTLHCFTFVWIPGIYQQLSKYTHIYMYCYFAENGPNLIVHSYRAALQEIILEKDPSFQRGAMKVTMKKAEEMPFHK